MNEPPNMTKADATQVGADWVFSRERASAVIREYYSRIDASDTDWVIALFEQDAIYERADASYEGIPAIARFFRDERKIRGVHSIDTLIVDEEQSVVVALGRFSGVGQAVDARTVGFADIWHLSSTGRVTLRRTYLAIGHEYVRD